MAELTVGATVRLVSRPPYLKTADPMPMLRPPTLLELGAKGVVVTRNPGGTWTIKFEGGTYLLDSQYLELVNS
ncbi:DUF3148 domain-containing protein [Phormidium yuhuli AB48]|uniref:DUF3148 domain-containing protein n=1 Tax=Phormidium yuhuli AB48 TaxID=2940671 RepID=A0ABY5AWA8_9CYAN|nr:DUF3148 domain-containing protein [Phormidium yuhuli]USR93051.1 DUF3148 domain-containing protein [Phormidium yuhuli AB48]